MIGKIIILITLLYGTTSFKTISRQDWGARPPKQVEKIEDPVPYVIIHHSYIPGACRSTNLCKKAMQDMQIFHQDDRHWNDIGYNFAVGGDGYIYEGRGYKVVGAHAPKYNDKSMGICVIGDWREKLPSKWMLNAVQELIADGVENNYIQHNYTLLGHRQVRDTECPGQALFDEIRKWPHFSESVATNPNDV